MIIELKKFFPKIKVSFSKKNYISPRVLYANVEKTDKRSSEIKKISKNYYKVISGKIDHSVDIAKRLKKIFQNNN